MYLTVGPNILVGQQETPVSHYPIYICMLHKQQPNYYKKFKKNGKGQLFEQFKDTCTECPKILCYLRNYTGKKLHNSKEFIHTKPMMLRQTSNILSNRKLNNLIFFSLDYYLFYIIIRGRRKLQLVVQQVITYLSIYQWNWLLQNARVLGEGNVLANQF